MLTPYKLFTMVLDPVQTRVLGSLIEKEIVTPESYPLSLNALVNACNQKSSREPVMELSEDEVRQALHTLEDENLVSTLHDSRVPKYEHRIRTVLNLRRDETAVLCLLMLRGPQTAGELRGRAERMYSFDDIAAAQATLERLASREPASESDTTSTGPLTVLLPRQPGSRESRYMHLLSGAPDLSSPVPARTAIPSAGESADTARITQLEQEVATLTAALAALQSRVERLESPS
ncbi:YceH family protein [Edaphobacter flagellatus]|uniref:YceH family protein n=1 Tax=Edaphobacter flagellatus TaxID=1933044 RepID=UPI0021B2CD91|nr:YceH family protein [Edaphobacter flagellatus]